MEEQVETKTMKKTKGRILTAELVGQPPEMAINLSINGRNIALVKLDQVASRNWCHIVGKHLMTCSGFKVDQSWRRIQ